MLKVDAEEPWNMLAQMSNFAKKGYTTAPESKFNPYRARWIYDVLHSRNCNKAEYFIDELQQIPRYIKKQAGLVTD